MHWSDLLPQVKGDRNGGAINSYCHGRALYTWRANSTLPPSQSAKVTLIHIGFVNKSTKSSSHNCCYGVVPSMQWGFYCLRDLGCSYTVASFVYGNVSLSLTRTAKKKLEPCNKVGVFEITSSVFSLRFPYSVANGKKMLLVNSVARVTSFLLV